MVQDLESPPRKALQESGYPRWLYSDTRWRGDVKQNRGQAARGCGFSRHAPVGPDQALRAWPGSAIPVPCWGARLGGHAAGCEPERLKTVAGWAREAERPLAVLCWFESCQACNPIFTEGNRPPALATPTPDRTRHRASSRGGLRQWPPPTRRGGTRGRSHRRLADGARGPASRAAASKATKPTRAGLLA